MPTNAKLLPVAAACLALSSVAWSEIRWEREKKDAPGLEERMELLEKRLELDDAQKKNIRKILEEAEPEQKKIRDEMESLREKVKSLGERARNAERKTHERVREELKGEQRDKFDEMRVRMRGMRRGGRGGGGGGTVRPGGRSGMPHQRFKRGGGGSGEDEEGWDGYELPPGGVGGPERWELEPRRGRRELPDELRERIERRRRMREGQGEGEQRDVPPPEEWGESEGIHGYDRAAPEGLFNEPPMRPQGNE